MKLIRKTKIESREDEERGGDKRLLEREKISPTENKLSLLLQKLKDANGTWELVFIIVLGLREGLGGLEDRLYNAILCQYHIRGRIA